MKEDLDDMEKVTFQAWWLCFMDGAILTSYKAVKDHTKLTGHIEFKIHPKETNA